MNRYHNYGKGLRTELRTPRQSSGLRVEMDVYYFLSVANLKIGDAFARRASESASKMGGQTLSVFGGKTFPPKISHN